MNSLALDQKSTVLELKIKSIKIKAQAQAQAQAHIPVDLAKQLIDDEKLAAIFNANHKPPDQGL